MFNLNTVGCLGLHAAQVHCGSVGGRVGGELGASSCAEARQIRSAQALLRHLRGGGAEQLVGTPLAR